MGKQFVIVNLSQIVKHLDVKAQPNERGWVKRMFFDDDNVKVDVVIKLSDLIAFKDALEKADA